MLIDYGFCTGCHSCEISCRKEHGYSLDEWGIKITGFGPEKLGGAWSWDYIPTLSSLCDLCEERRSRGEVPICQLHCLANVIEVLPVEHISSRILELGHSKVLAVVP